MMENDSKLTKGNSPAELVLEILYELGYGQRDNFGLETEHFTEEGYVSYVFYHEEFGFMSYDIQICVTPEGLVLFYHGDEGRWYELKNSAEEFFQYVFFPKPRKRKYKNKQDR